MRISIKRAIAEAIPVDLHIRVERLTGYDSSPDVVLLASSPAWLLGVDLGNGLNPYGYVAVLRSHVQSLHTTKHRTFRKRVLESEGIWPRIIRIPSIELIDAAAILRSLKTREEFAIVLCETYHEWDSIYCRVEHVTDDKATLRGFDGAGQWEPRSKHVDISDITRIYFGSPYLKLYQKYASRTPAASVQ